MNRNKRKGSNICNLPNIAVYRYRYPSQIYILDVYVQGPTTGSRVRVWAFCVACSWLMPTAHNQDPETCAWHSRILCVDRRSKNKTRMCFSLESLKTLLRITKWYQLLCYITVFFLDLTAMARFQGLKNRFLFSSLYIYIYFWTWFT